MQEDRRKKERASPGLMGDTLLLLFKIAFSLIFLLVVFTMIFGIALAKDESMRPAVREGDMALYYRLDKDYRARDLIVVDENGESSVRRVIATSGDRVDMNENGLIINGYGQQEDEIYTDTEAFVEGITYPLSIPEGQVFVMGDDRPSARDSRMYGPVDINSATKGRVLLVLRRRHL